MHLYYKLDICPSFKRGIFINFLYKYNILAFLLIYYLIFLAFATDKWSLYINCGGGQVSIYENRTEKIYEQDNDGANGVSTFQLHTNWAYSSTGSFLDSRDNNNFVATATQNLSLPDSQLYATARLSPFSLTYFGFCLLNKNYTVKLHFAEIIILDYNGYISPGRRIFDVYIQVGTTLRRYLN